jgi:uncharacterized phiE125 gp8 family phage protein
MPALTTSDIKAHLRIFHTQDDSYIGSILLPAVRETIERCTGLAMQALERSYKVSDEDDTWVVLPIQPVNTASAITAVYVDDDDVTQTETPELHWDGERVAVLIDKAWNRPVTINWNTLVGDHYINMLALQLCGRLYADRGDSTNAIEGKAEQMLMAMLGEHGVH